MTARTKAATIWRLRGLAFWALVVAVAWVMGMDSAGQTSAAAAAPAPSWGEHLDLVQAVIVVLFGFGVWSARSKLSRIDKKFDMLFEWRQRITGQVERLQGEHDAMKGCRVPHRRHDDGEET